RTRQSAPRECNWAGRIAHGRRDRTGSPRRTRAGLARRKPQYGRKCSGRGGPCGYRSGPSRRDDGDGGGRYGEIYGRTVEAANILKNSRMPDQHRPQTFSSIYYAKEVPGMKRMTIYSVLLSAALAAYGQTPD